MLTYDVNTTTVKCPEELYTGFSGIRTLNSFYSQLAPLRDRDIRLDFSRTTFFEANMSSLLLAMIHKLTTENGLNFFVDTQHLKGDMDVFLRNGLIKMEETIVDTRKSTVRCNHFLNSQCKEFKDYVSNELFDHRAFNSIPNGVKQPVIRDHLEIFNNYIAHSKSEYPFFVCGQYFPKIRTLVFTMADLGVGFLPAITAYTSGAVKNSLDAIRWAVAGNSSKSNQDEMPAGLGLNRNKRLLFS